MKPYTIRYSRTASKQLASLSTGMQSRVIAAITPLADNPRPSGSKKLKGNTNEFRIRVGQYRVIYEIHDNELIVLIVRIAHRKDAYR